MATKQYVLDTNVLLHDPECIFKFEENDLSIPVEVLEELDSIKTEQSTERGRNARQVHRHLQSLLPNTESMTQGAKLPGGGTLRVVINRYLVENNWSSPAMQRLRAIISDFSRKDNRIIASALFVQETCPPPTILVTKDINMALKARAAGLEVQDYLNDKTEEPTPASESYRRCEVDGYAMQRFGSEGSVEIEATLPANEYVLLATPEGKTMPARAVGGNIVRRLRIPEAIKSHGCIPIRPRNLEQQFFVDALLDDSISLITCFGKAGTGKTLLSIAAGLYQTCGENAGNRYDSISISRPVITLGKDIGFLPGSLEEKLRPWLQSYHDALEVLMPSKQPKEPQFVAKAVGKKARRQIAPTATPAPNGSNGSIPMKPYERLLRSGLIEIEALCYIRGRSIARRFFILDEAQQLTPHEAKSIITRAGEGSKFVLIGDPAQIDNPYVDSRSNGLVYTSNHMRGQAMHAHVTLSKGERSLLAEIAANVL